MYPGQRGGTELDLLKAKFYQVLSKHFSDEAFMLAAGKVEEIAKFFPVIAQVMDFKNDVIAEMARVGHSSILSLPEETDNLTEEEIEQNRQRVEIICKQLAGTLTMEEAIKEQEELVTFAKK